MDMALEMYRYTIDDLEQFPDGRQRYELIDGMLFVTPGPSLRHQTVVAWLIWKMARTLPDSTSVNVFTSGVVMSQPGTLLIPDLLVCPHAPRHLEWKDITEHWLAVEVLSRSTRARDRGIKRATYFALGVKEVWLVDRESRTVEVCRSETESEVVSDVFRWKVPTLDIVVTVEVAELFGAPT